MHKVNLIPKPTKPPTLYDKLRYWLYLKALKQVLKSPKLYTLYFRGAK
jgi:hypothetical protein